MGVSHRWRVTDEEITDEEITDEEITDKESQMKSHRWRDHRCRVTDAEITDKDWNYVILVFSMSVNIICTCGNLCWQILILQGSVSWLHQPA
jgi:hypothetical protein